MYTVDNFLLGLRKLFPNYKFTCDDEKVVITQDYYSDFGESEPAGQDEIGAILLSELNEVISGISADVMDSLFVYNQTSCEVLVQPDRSIGPSYRYIERQPYYLSCNGYIFDISKASSTYVLAMICFIATREDINTEVIPVRPYFAREYDAVHSLNDLARSMRWLTAKISAPTELQSTELRKMIQSYLFNICYNSSALFAIPNLHVGNRIKRQRTHRTGQLFPFKHYNQKLVKYYYQGVSCDIPFAQYLAFYHVAEYFFQSIAEDDAFTKIEEFITHPSFSPHKKEDIRRFYSTVKRIMHTQKESDLWDEKTGFLLCLKRYIPDLDVLKTTINTIDSSALDYYKTTEVSFTDAGCKVNFDANSDNIYANIHNRVYSIRNAIVHSKEGERLKYEPFKHDRELAKEIPLIRAIAEEIIINTSKPLEIRVSATDG